MKAARSVVLAADVLLSTVAAAQQSTFLDAYGRVIGKERTDANGVTEFYDAAGRTTDYGEGYGLLEACGSRPISPSEKCSDRGKYADSSG